MYYPGGGQAQTNIAYQDQISTSPRPDTNINPHPPPYTEYGQAYPQQPFILQPQPLAPVQQQVVNTNVVLQQPAPVVAQGPRDWTSGLLDCGDNGTVCKWLIYILKLEYASGMAANGSHFESSIQI